MSFLNADCEWICIFKHGSLLNVCIYMHIAYVPNYAREERHLVPAWQQEACESQLSMLAELSFALLVLLKHLK